MLQKGRLPSCVHRILPCAGSASFQDLLLSRIGFPTVLVLSACNMPLAHLNFDTQENERQTLQVFEIVN